MEGLEQIRYYINGEVVASMKAPHLGHSHSALLLLPKLPKPSHIDVAMHIAIVSSLHSIVSCSLVRAEPMSRQGIE